MYFQQNFQLSYGWWYMVAAADAMILFARCKITCPASSLREILFPCRLPQMTITAPHHALREHQDPESRLHGCHMSLVMQEKVSLFPTVSSHPKPNGTQTQPVAEPKWIGTCSASVFSSVAEICNKCCMISFRCLSSNWGIWGQSLKQIKPCSKNIQN